MSIALRVAGVVVLMAGTALPLERALVGEAIFWWLVSLGLVVGLLLQTWWSLLLVPAASPGFAVVIAAVSPEQRLFSEGFTITAGIVALAGLAMLSMGSAALGTGTAKAIERRIAHGDGQ